MKYRKDFVTNSSSSSFVCEICGRHETSWEGMSEVDMYECVNGHTFCVDESLEVENNELVKVIISKGYNHVTHPENKTYTESELSEMEHSGLFDFVTDGEGVYGVPECMCPICNFLEYSQLDMCTYLKKKYQVSRDDAFAEIKAINRRRKKLYDHEYITYVCKKFDLNPIEIIESWKVEFDSYHAFRKYLNIK